ncbi:MAG: SCO family protein [Proteobacteria bacterium]|nr:SCO family protein [Pseudomonadota bacterium]
MASIWLTSLSSNTLAQMDIDALELPLLSETGQLTTINDFKAPLRLVFFGFTYCPDICPLTLYKIGGALRSLELPAESIDVLFISVDPKRDTPEVLTQYTDAFHENIIGLSGTISQLESLMLKFRTHFGYNLLTEAGEEPIPLENYTSLSSDENYTPYHSSQIYLLNQHGEIVDLIGHGSDPKLIIQTISKAIEPLIETL